MLSCVVHAFNLLVAGLDQSHIFGLDPWLVLACQHGKTDDRGSRSYQGTPYPCLPNGEELDNNF